MSKNQADPPKDQDDSDKRKMDEVLRKMLKTPPKPAHPKPKKGRD